MSTNVRHFQQESKPKLTTLQMEGAILESLFPDQIEKPILRVIRSLSARLDRLYQTDIANLPDDEARRLLSIAHNLEEQRDGLHGALIAAQHMQLTYLETINANSEYYLARLERLRRNRLFWKESCHQVAIELANLKKAQQ